MKRMKIVTTAALLGAAALAGGCASEREVLFFGTHTALGVDVSGTVGVPDSISLGYQRREVAVVPPKKDGTARSVLGATDSDLGLGDLRLKQLFATGEAARQAAGSPTAPATPAANAGTSRQPILFTTEANLSLLHVQASSSSLAPRLSLGYSRSEITLIPVAYDDNEAASVYADISIESGSADKPDSQSTSNVEKELGQHPSRFSGGIRLVQSFATGDAAVRLVENNTNKAKDRLLSAVAGKTVAAIGAKRQEADLDGKLAADFGKIKDLASRKAVIVWANGQFKASLQGSERCDTQPDAQALSRCFTGVLLPKLNLGEKNQLNDHMQNVLSQ
ncbi:MAG: hypothetical protein K8F27_02035 [Sulfuricellaceae bacterium]|nr:hypothetical protein [Sulfuricellaceae bacterium]